MPKYLLGTDDQGRDILSTLIYGARISLIVGFAAVLLSAVMGVFLGVLSGYVGGWIETIVMRTADVQLTVPGILIALMIDGVSRAALPSSLREEIAIYVVILAIGLSDWPGCNAAARSAGVRHWWRRTRNTSSRPPT